MQDLVECQAYLVHLREEHRQLHELVREIQMALESPAGSLDADLLHRMRRRLQNLRKELARHFSEEDAGGCIEEAVSRRPSLAAEARQVAEQHLDLLRQLDGIIEEAAEAPQSMQTSFPVFAKQLLSHEASENRIIERGFNINLDS